MSARWDRKQDQGKHCRRGWGPLGRYLPAGLALALLVSAATDSAWAQAASQAEGEAAPKDSYAEHIVVEGETLQGITESYLGTYRLWRENWRLNPDIQNPNFLRIGQRLRVISARQLPARSAEIQRVANDVDKILVRSEDWEEAAPGDLLFSEEGLRTARSSSADLQFDDGSQLTVSESSRVFLKKVETTLTGVRKGTIELEQGQVDLALLAPRPGRSDIELVLGGAVSRPRPTAAGRAETRLRRVDSGGSQVMVYRGSSQVESGGQQVQVATGQGVSVPEEGPPTQPETLLPRPVPETRSHRQPWDFTNPPFSWRAVAGAVSYTVEVCRDRGCGQLVQRQTGLTETEWLAGVLPQGELYWRVNAVAASGLDGYASRPVAFDVVGEIPDLEPPVVSVLREGSGAATADGSWLLGAGAGLRLVAADDASGVRELRYRWNGGDWRRAGRSLIKLPSGEQWHTLEAEATDRLGRQSEPWSLRVRQAGAAPEPPLVRRVQNTGARGSTGSEEGPGGSGSGGSPPPQGDH